MILDSYSNLNVYGAINGKIKMALDYIGKNDLSKLEMGRHDIDGDDVFLIIQNYHTKDIQEGVWEAHKKYIDIHYMIDGSELIGFANIDKLKVSQPYDEKDDCWLFSGEGDSITLDKGMFAIFFPQDVHMTSLIVQESKPVKKAVIKVRID
ncbi:Toxin-antitoxin biofilm protein TabA [Paraliobacillus sp. PM-2]|uniref:YhcH/YjgK/YiaL family protein n=1 Tax=Paraliobacillus sp. PM-2 TaxID=1462524 RepID=UPI00061CC4C4|nr:YhcH/YjgK/YiaL family protein [Paraliobacillus sp. PM-2]CQR47364.1 Toxin-antitoxin biofilm protein TabA [Paraliobacillus sp. PM-2]